MVEGVREVVLLALGLSLALTACAPTSGSANKLGSEYLQAVASSNSERNVLYGDWEASVNAQEGQGQRVANLQAEARKLVVQLFKLDKDLGEMARQMPMGEQRDVGLVRSDLAREITDLQAAGSAEVGEHVFVELGAWGQDWQSSQADWNALRRDVGLGPEAARQH
jgi:hypothetical protein